MYQSADDETLIVPLQIRLYVSGIEGKYDDTIFVTQLPLQSVRELDGSKLALHVQGPSVLFSSYFGIGDPVVFEGRIEVVLHRGCDPDDPAGV